MLDKHINASETVDCLIDSKKQIRGIRRKVRSFRRLFYHKQRCFESSIIDDNILSSVCID